MSFPSVILPLFLLLLRCSTTFATGPGADQYQYDFNGEAGCPAVGYTSIGTFQECSDAAATSGVLFYGNFGGADLPSRCNFDNDCEGFFWNNNSELATDPGPFDSNFSPVCKVAPGASAGGDPHLIDFHNQAFTYQGVCDVVLSSSENAVTGHGLRVHARLSEALNKGFSFMSGVGVQIGGVPIEFQNGEMYVHGKFQPLKEGEKFFDPAAVSTVSSSSAAAAAGSHAVAGSLYVVTKWKRTIGKNKRIIEHIFDFFDGSSIIVRSNLKAKMMFVEMSGRFDGADDMQGLLGSPYKNGFLSRSGENMDAMDINDFGQEWQVLETEVNLFMDANREPQAPSKCIVVTSATAQLRGRRRLLEKDDGRIVDMETAAQDACSHVHDSKKKAFCIDDVIVTGMVELADDPFYE